MVALFMVSAPGIGRHDDDDVAEVGFAAVVVGQRAVIHHLQQHVEDVRVGFSISSNSSTLCGFLLMASVQQATLVAKPTPTGRRADQAADMALHVFAHCRSGSRPNDVGCWLLPVLPTPGGAAEQEGADRLVLLAGPARAILTLAASTSEPYPGQNHALQVAFRVLPSYHGRRC